jgi:hypothetical protein
MDLTKNYPRSPHEKMLDMFSLPRVIDKASASNEGTLGEYDYDCPHDKPVLEFLGVDGATFAKKVAELKTDSALADWIKRDTAYAQKSPQDVATFNEGRLKWAPAPGSPGEGYFNQMRANLAPDRTDIKTWFDILDLDEKRSVQPAHA